MMHGYAHAGRGRQAALEALLEVGIPLERELDGLRDDVSAIGAPALVLRVLVDRLDELGGKAEAYVFELDSGTRLDATSGHLVSFPRSAVASASSGGEGASDVPRAVRAEHTPVCACVAWMGGSAASRRQADGDFRVETGGG